MLQLDHSHYGKWETETAHRPVRPPSDGCYEEARCFETLTLYIFKCRLVCDCSTAKWWTFRATKIHSIPVATFAMRASAKGKGDAQALFWRSRHGVCTYPIYCAASGNITTREIIFQHVNMPVVSTWNLQWMSLLSKIIIRSSNFFELNATYRNRIQCQKTGIQCFTTVLVALKKWHELNNCSWRIQVKLKRREDTNIRRSGWGVRNVRPEAPDLQNILNSVRWTASSSSKSQHRQRHKQEGNKLHHEKHHGASSRCSKNRNWYQKGILRQWIHLSRRTMASFARGWSFLAGCWIRRLG